MGIERITLNFDTDDGNSMMLCSILKEIKRGHRMEVIADNILSVLDEHSLLEKFADNPAAMAKVLVMFSENYRTTKNSAFTTSTTVRSTPSRRTRKAKRTKDEAKSSGNKDCKKYLSVPADKATGDNAIEEIPDKQSILNGNHHLPPDQWIKQMNSEAMKYFKENVQTEQYEAYMEALRMLGDDEDIYEELIIAPGLILNQYAPLPSTEMSFENWLTEQLNNKGMYKEK